MERNKNIPKGDNVRGTCNSVFKAHPDLIHMYFSLWEVHSEKIFDLVLLNYLPSTLNFLAKVGNGLLNENSSVCQHETSNNEIFIIQILNT